MLLCYARHRRADEKPIWSWYGWRERRRIVEGPICSWCGWRERALLLFEKTDFTIENLDREDGIAPSSGHHYDSLHTYTLQYVLDKPPLS